MLVLIILALGLLVPARARAQQLSLQVESEEIYANLPFVLTVVAAGFQEQPQPTLSPLTITGCRVTPLGVAPNVSSMVQIVNGQRSEHRSVTFAFRFRVEATGPGAYQIPALTATQGGATAQSRSVSFQARGLSDTQDMRVRLQLPERPVWIGETFDVALEWYLRRDVSNRSFVVPLFDMDDAVEVEPAPGNEQRLGGFHAGPRELELPFQRDRAVLDGVEYTRFRFLARVTPIKSGALQAAAPRVMAMLQTGVGRDFFGFPQPTSSLFQAVGKPVRLEVRAPPLKGRPPSFQNAIGSAFSIEVQAPRTVVRVGDPLDLRVLIRGRGRLQGLMLPDLNAAGLSASEFAVPKDPPAGEVLPDQKGKLFPVQVRLRSAAARQIPALSFGYFDPEKGAYQVAQSQPIALSVQGSAVVGAADVVGTAPPAGTPAPAAPSLGRQGESSVAALALGGAELALSSEADTLRRVRSVRDLRALLVVLYGAPLLLLLWRLLQQRGGAARAQRQEGAEALAELEQALVKAAEQPAREAAPRLAAALREVQRRAAPAQAAQVKPLLERLETEAYSPQAAHTPLVPELLSEIGRSARGWLGALLAVALWGALAGTAAAAPASPGEALAAARRTYQEALAQKDADRRREAFARAEALFRELAAAQPDRPELLADWGNAALLAQEPGSAVLAYKRALRLDRGLLRARRNLTFVREHLPEWLPRTPEAGAVDTLFFWHRTLGTAQRHVVAALAFALLVLLSTLRRRLLALLPALVLAAMALSLWQDSEREGDAVVLLPGVLRTADSSGAPAVLARPLPAGAEVRLREARGDFAQIELADGQRGWISRTSVERVDP